MHGHTSRPQAFGKPLDERESPMGDMGAMTLHDCAAALYCEIVATPLTVVAANRWTHEYFIPAYPPACDAFYLAARRHRGAIDS